MKTTNMSHRSETLSLSQAPASPACGIDDVRAALLQSEARYRILLDDFPVAVYCCDANGKLTLFNAAAVQLWGRSPEIGMDSWCGSHRMFTVDGHPLPLDRCPMALTLLEQQDIGVAEPLLSDLMARAATCWLIPAC